MLASLALWFATQNGLTLTYETSGFKSSGDYAEAVSFCRRLAELSPQAHLISIGHSASGREMFALTVSKEGDPSPEALRKSGRPLIYIECGIHAGEIEGKDASLLLLRDLLIGKKSPDLLDDASLIVIPVLNVDGHERRSPFNRINQNGPTEMGWRANDQNLNLNRDWMKLDAPETKAAVALISRYKPDFFIDNHTTDGADYPYQVMLGVPSTPSLHPAVAAWASGLYDSVSKDLDTSGITASPYFEFNGDDPSRGIYLQDYSPRYSTGYWGARNRPSMLIETHMLKPYKVRVDATYQAMLRAIRYVGAHREALRSAVSEAESHDTAAVGAYYVLASEVTAAKRSSPFHLYEARPYVSEVTGGTVIHWAERQKEALVDIQDQFAPTVGVTAPAGYAIPAALTSVIDILRAHGLKLETLKAPLRDTFSSYRFLMPRLSAQPFEGRNTAEFGLEAISEERTLLPGTVVAGCDGPDTRLLLQLLEPAAPDSFAHWGFLNAFFEQKEYFETYSMEPIAAQMMREQPGLRAQFEEALKDPKFASNPYARLAWFYERSPYADKRLNKYPIVRLTSAQLALARGR